VRFHLGWSGWGVKLTTPPIQVPRLRTSGSVRLLPPTCLQGKHRTSSPFKIWMYCIPSAYKHGPANNQAPDIVGQFPVASSYKIVFNATSHQVTTAATSRSSLNLWPPTIYFRAGNMTISRRQSELCQERSKVLSLRYYAPSKLVSWQTYMAHILQLIKCPQTYDTDKRDDERIRPYSITHIVLY
jgi:hypothetical protein